MLIIYFMHDSVYMLILASWFIPTPSFPMSNHKFFP